MGYVGNNGTTDVDYQASIAQRTAASPTGVAGAFRNGATTGSGYSDFDQSYNPINSYEQGSGGGGYVVRKGDTLAGLAAGLYGDGSRPSGLLRLELIPRINSCAHAHRLRRVQDR